jgi:cAMP-dependent protein kinase regulator
MSSASFTSPFGANSNPFGARSGAIQRVIEEEEENDAITSPTTLNFGLKPHSPFASPFGRPSGGGDAAADAPPSALSSPPGAESYPAQYNFSRRTSVSAESLKPVADTYDNWQPPVHPKSPQQLERLKKAIEGNFLFSHLDDEQSAQILGALVEKPIPAKGIKVSTPLPGCFLRTKHPMAGRPL